MLLLEVCAMSVVVDNDTLWYYMRMAIGYIRESSISRKKGLNIIESAAYRSGEKLLDWNRAKIFCRKDPEEVLHSEIQLPKGAPEKFKDREVLWNFVNEFEKRKDSSTAREVIAALPVELELEHWIEMCEKFCEQVFIPHGVAVDFAIHKGKDNNPHVHFLRTKRTISELGISRGFAKDLEVEVRYGRVYKAVDYLSLWTDFQNQYFRELGIDLRVDANAAIPGVHEGRYAFHGKGKTSDRRIENQKRIAQNQEVCRNNPELVVQALLRNYDDFSINELEKYLSKFLSDKEEVRRAVSKVQMLPELVFLSSSKKDDVTPYYTTIDKIERNPELRSRIINQAHSRDNATDEPVKPDEVRYETLSDFIKQTTKNKGVFSDDSLKFHIDKKGSDVTIESLIDSKVILDIGIGEDGRTYYTTPEFFKIESELERHVSLISSKNTLKVSSSKLRKAIKRFEVDRGFELSQQQKDALAHCVSGKDFAVVLGYAGTGKSTGMAIAADLWRRKGCNIHALSLSAVAAAGIGDAMSTPGKTIDSFLFRCRNSNPRVKLNLSNKDVVVIDEAGMADAEKLRDIASIVSDAGAKLVLMGDTEQLPAIGAGASLKGLSETFGASVIHTVIRQKDKEQRKATEYFATGKVDKAFEAYAKDLHFDDFGGQHERCVDDWFASQSDIKEKIILALSNQSVDMLNDMAREKLVGASVISTKEQQRIVNDKGREIALSANDRIVFLKNDLRLGVKNGTFGTVKSVRDGITVQTDDGKAVTFDPNEYSNINYGYAVTVHKAQGKTVDEAYVCVNKIADRHWLYVAMSRHRDKCKAYFDNSEFSDIASAIKHFSKVRLIDSTLQFPHRFALARDIVFSSVYDRLKAFARTAHGKLVALLDVILDRKQRQAKEESKLTPEQEVAKTAKEWIDVNRDIGRLGTQLTESLQKEKRLMDVYTTHLASLKRFDGCVKVGEFSRENYNKLKSEHSEKMDEYSSLLDSRLGSMNLTEQIDLTTKLQKKAKEDYFTKRNSHELTAKIKVRSRKKMNLAYKLSQNIKLANNSLRYHGKSMEDLVGDVGRYRKAALADDVKKYIEAGQTVLAMQQIRRLSLPKDFGVLADAGICFDDANALSRRLKIFETKKDMSAHERSVYAKIRHYNHIITDSYKASELVPDNNPHEKLAWSKVIGSAGNKKTLAIKELSKESIKKFLELKIIRPAHQKEAAPEVSQEALALYQVAQSQYMELNRRTGLAFSESSHAKDNAISQAFIDNKLAVASDLARKRDEAAIGFYSAIQASPSLAEFHKIDVGKVEKHAALGRAREIAREYVDSKESGTIKHIMLADKLLNSPKKIWFEFGVWPSELKKSLEHRKYLESHRKLTLRHDKRASRLVREYRIADSKARRLFGRHISMTKEGVPTIAHYKLMQSVNDKRNNIASALSYLGVGVDAINAGKEGKPVSVKAFQFQAKVGDKSQVKTKKLWHLAQAEQRILRQTNDATATHSPELGKSEHGQIKQKNRQKQHNPPIDFGALTSALASDIGVLAEAMMGPPKKTERNSLRYSGGLLVNMDNGSWYSHTDGVGGGPLQLISYAKYNQASFKSLTPSQKKEVIDAAKDFAGVGDFSSDSSFYRHAPSPAVKAPKSEAIDAQKQRKMQAAQRIFQGAKPIAGTLAEQYLKNRGIEAKELNGDIRFDYTYNGELKKKVPALIIGARDKSNNISSVQRIFLDNNASKAKVKCAKMTLGPSKDLLALLHQGESNQVYITEGPEDAAAIASVAPDATVYCVFGQSGFANAHNLVDNTKDVCIVADNDKADSGAKKSLIKHCLNWSQSARNVTVVYPKLDSNEEKTDFNDILKKKGIEAAKETLQNKQKPMDVARTIDAKLIGYIDLSNQAPKSEDAVRQKEVGLGRLASKFDSNLDRILPGNMGQKAAKHRAKHQRNEKLLDDYKKAKSELIEKLGGKESIIDGYIYDQKSIAALIKESSQPLSRLAKRVIDSGLEQNDSELLMMSDLTNSLPTLVKELIIAEKESYKVKAKEKNPDQIKYHLRLELLAKQEGDKKSIHFHGEMVRLLKQEIGPKKKAWLAESNPKLLKYLESSKDKGFEQSNEVSF